MTQIVMLFGAYVAGTAEFTGNDRFAIAVLVVMGVWIAHRIISLTVPEP